MTSKAIFTTLFLTATGLFSQPTIPSLPATFPVFGVTTLRVAFMGDSFAAGEGSPNLTGQKWNNPHPGCHNSDENGRSAAARKVQDRMVVLAERLGRRLEFIDVACSGATINGSIIGENYRGVTPLTESGPGPVGAPIPSQVSQVKTWLAGKKLDMLVLSVGGNDVGFGEVSTKCMTPLTSCKDDPQLMNMIRRGKHGSVETVGLDFLPNAYATMKQRIDADLKPEAVYVIGVPNPLRDQDGRFCDRFDDGVGILPANLADPFNGPFIAVRGITTIGTVSTAELDKDEARFVEEQFINPLNARLEQIVNSFTSSNWRFVDIDFMTRLHGFCSSDPWFHTFKTSLATQGDFNGIGHPRRAGYQVYEAFTYRLLARHFDVRTTDAPRTDQEPIQIAYRINGENKIMPADEFETSLDRIFVGNNFSVRFRSLVFPAADVLTSLTLQISRKPLAQSTPADISNIAMDVDPQKTGNFARNVSVNGFADGTTLHVRWRTISRPFFDADGPSTTKFSPTIRVKVKDGLKSAREL